MLPSFRRIVELTLYKIPKNRTQMTPSFDGAYADAADGHGSFSALIRRIRVIRVLFLHILLISLLLLVLKGLILCLIKCINYDYRRKEL